MSKNYTILDFKSVLHIPPGRHSLERKTKSGLFFLGGKSSHEQRREKSVWARVSEMKQRRRKAILNCSKIGLQ